ncbi:MAG: VTT domain-containing protein [Clostridium sp.]
MKRNLKPIIIILIWIICGFYIYKLDILNSKDSIIMFLEDSNNVYGYIIFIILSVIRIALFIPQTILIITGSIIFGPITGTILSVIALILSQSIMYVVGRYFGENSLIYFLLNENNRYKDLLKKYGYKMISMGIICPIAPSDVIVMITGYLRFSYIRSLVVIILSDLPMIFLYSLAASFNTGYIVKVISLLSIIGVSIYGIYIFIKIKKEYALGGEISDKIY